jgi:2-(1,2-epoxy-1,2-dihydrophenyl)acetyl-CoA isomerase
MGTVFIKRATASDCGAAFWLPRIVGIAKAFELFYSGELLDAPSALKEGLVSRVIPDDLLLQEAIAYASLIAKGPPLAFTALRRVLLRSTEMTLHQFLEYEWTAQLDLLKTSDCIEGFRSFVERREPRFTGE